MLAAFSDVKNAKRQLKHNQEDIYKEQRFLFGEVKMIVTTALPVQNTSTKIFRNIILANNKIISVSYTHLTLPTKA